MELENAWGDRRLGADRRAGGNERRGSVGNRRQGD
jgi:hypothetical protein